jgi:glycosyltransferase involved in cell wall biosynthesis
MNMACDDFASGQRVGGVSMVLPLYNEERNICRVLRFIRTLDFVDEVVVVDDGSSDSTVARVRRESWDKVRLVRRARNGGKTKAVIEGVHATRHPTILLFDGDLEGVTYAEMKLLITRHRQGYGLVVMHYGGQRFLSQRVLDGSPAVSGVRVLAREHFARIGFRKRDRFQLDQRITDYFMDNGFSIAIVNSPGLRTPSKSEKYGPWRGVPLDLKARWEILLGNGVVGLPGLISRFRYLRSLVDNGARHEGHCPLD